MTFKFPDEAPGGAPAAGNDEDDLVVQTEGDGDIDIEVVDDTPEKDKGRKPLERPVVEPTDEELENYSEGVKRRIQELTHAKHDERRAKEAIQREKIELERMAQQLLAQNRALEAQYNNGAQHYAATLKQATEATFEMAKREYKEAYESGDAEKVMAAQAKMTEAQMKVAEAQRFRPEVAQQRDPVVQTQQSETQPNALDDKTLRWQAKNQWFGADGFEEVTSFSLGLHQKLVNSGVDPASDEYFTTIDHRLRAKFPEVFSDDPSAAKGAKKPAAVVAAATRASGPRTIKLTATQVALAKKFGLTPKQYALEIAKLENSNG